MSYAERKKLFEEFSTVRKRPMITYVTSIRPNLSVNMSVAQQTKVPISRTKTSN